MKRGWQKGRVAEREGYALDMGSRSEAVAFCCPCRCRCLLRADKKRSFDDTLAVLKDTVEIQPQGHAIDKEYPDIIYVPETSKFSMITQVFVCMMRLCMSSMLCVLLCECMMHVHVLYDVRSGMVWVCVRKRARQRKMTVV